MRDISQNLTPCSCEEIIPTHVILSNNTIKLMKGSYILRYDSN